MALNTFDVTSALVASDMFPQWTFDANSTPTAVVVARFVDEEAADLAGRLYAENITASSITEEAHEVAFTWCAKTLKLMVARRVFAVTSQQDPELRKSYSAELKERLDLLAQQGGTALGDSTLETGSSPADGPSSHISRNGLRTLAAEDMSTAIPPLRKDDRL